MYLIVTQSSTVLGDTCENAKDVRNMVRAQCPGLYGKVVAIALPERECSWNHRGRVREEPHLEVFAFSCAGRERHRLPTGASRRSSSKKLTIKTTLSRLASASSPEAFSTATRSPFGCRS